MTMLQDAVREQSKVIVPKWMTGAEGRPTEVSALIDKLLEESARRAEDARRAAAAPVPPPPVSPPPPPRPEPSPISQPPTAPRSPPVPPPPVPPPPPPRPHPSTISRPPAALAGAAAAARRRGSSRCGRPRRASADLTAAGHVPVRRRSRRRGAAAAASAAAGWTPISRPPVPPRHGRTEIDLATARGRTVAPPAALTARSVALAASAADGPPSEQQTSHGRRPVVTEVSLSAEEESGAACGTMSP